MDTEAVVKAIEYTDKQEQVQNYVGYIVDCIKKKYYEKKVDSHQGAPLVCSHVDL